jgi:hypothetical protein
MSHVRQQIRDAAVVLLTGLTSGAHVFAARDTFSHPLQDSELPAVIVDTADERAEVYGFGGSGRPLVCECDLRIRVVVKSVAGYADTVDTICAEVQTALVNAGKIAGCNLARYAGTAGPDVDASTDRPVALATMSFVMQYVVAANDPTTVV